MTAATSVDPNWLLSTTAQSSAALVGIIGGLLVSRLVALSSERSGLLRQAALLEERALRLDQEVAHLDLIALADAESEFIDERMSAVVERRGEVNPAVIVADFECNGFGGDWLASAAELLVRRVREAFHQIEAIDGRPDPDDLAAQGVAVPEGWEDLYLDVAYEVREERTDRRVGVAGLVDLPTWSARPPRGPDHDAIAERARWRARRPDAKEELATARAELALTDLGVDRLGDPRGMRAVLLVLVVFALVGVVQPLLLLAWRPVPAGPWMRGWIVVSFTAALLALLGFLWREVSALRRNPSTASATTTSVATTD